MDEDREESADLIKFREFVAAHGLAARPSHQRPHRLPRLMKWIFHLLPMRDDPARPFGHEGFTMDPVVRTLMAPYEPAVDMNGHPNDGRGGLIYFELLPADVAERLLALLPKTNTRERHEDAPSFEHFVQLGKEFLEVRFHGYRIDAHREDERIMITGYYYPAGEQADQVYRRARKLARAKPDDYYEIEVDGERLMYAWWD
jgi:hypothetical protein